VTDEMVGVALERRPHSATLVPEKREEITTEGGLDVAGQSAAVEAAVRELAGAGIRVGLFVDPDGEQLEASRRAGAHAVELHTGTYCDVWGKPETEREFARLCEAASAARNLGLAVHAGHGLNVRNVAAVARIPEVEELNIGHSLIGRAIFVGLQNAVAEMKSLIEREARQR
jgi:pyridoxine 5-phosphate synthase